MMAPKDENMLMFEADILACFVRIVVERKFERRVFIPWRIMFIA